MLVKSVLSNTVVYCCRSLILKTVWTWLISHLGPTRHLYLWEKERCNAGNRRFLERNWTLVRIPLKSVSGSPFVMVHCCLYINYCDFISIYYVYTFALWHVLYTSVCIVVCISSHMTHNYRKYFTAFHHSWSPEPWLVGVWELQKIISENLSPGTRQGEVWGWSGNGQGTQRFPVGNIPKKNSAIWSIQKTKDNVLFRITLSAREMSCQE